MSARAYSIFVGLIRRARGSTPRLRQAVIVALETSATCAALCTWGTGTAQDLHAALLVELLHTVAAGCSHLRLRVFEANSRARRFYERLGWTQTGQRTRSAFPPHAVLVEYQLPLSPSRRSTT